MEKTIISLKEALKSSPDNLTLRLLLANTLLQYNQFDEAAEEFQKVLTQDNLNKEAKLGLANIFFSKGEYSKSIVVLEDLTSDNSTDLEINLLYTRALVKDDDLGKAIEIYKEILHLNPNFNDEELDVILRVSSNSKHTEFDEDDESEAYFQDNFIKKPTINFDDVGGMDDIKREIDLKIIKPLQHPDLYKAYGKKIGGGILLYGPPGCGKTYLAKATAGQINAKFINVSLNNILDMWSGNSEKNLHEIFEVARNNTPCVLFFDEIDALGASRSDMKQSSSRHLINQFLQELDGIENDNDGVLILGATNAPWHLDTAFRRPGRFDRIIFVPPPDLDARAQILKLKLAEKPKEIIDYASLAKKTTSYSGADFEAVIDIAIESILEEAIKNGIPKAITTKDLKRALKKHKPSTKEWFTSAKNFALYANESGLYDEILNYLNIKK